MNTSFDLRKSGVIYRRMFCDRHKRSTLTNPSADLLNSFFVQPEMLEPIRQFVASVFFRSAHILNVSYILQVIQTRVCHIAIKMVDLHSLRAGADECLHNKYVNFAASTVRSFPESYLRPVQLILPQIQNMPSRIAKRMVRVWQGVPYTSKIADFKGRVIGDSSPNFNIHCNHMSNFNTGLAFEGAI